MKSPRFTIASLMILVAVLAVLIYMMLYSPPAVLCVLLPVQAAIIGRCYRKFGPYGEGLNPLRRVFNYLVVAWLALAMLAPLIGLRMVLALELGPSATKIDQLSAFLTLLPFAVVPLLLSLYCLWLLRSERSSRKEVRSVSDQPDF
jgi:hypothetical protein